jgi:hypothetical protein
MAQASQAAAGTSAIDFAMRIWTVDLGLGFVIGGLFSPDFTPEMERE